MLHLDFCTIGVCCWLPWQSPAVFFPAPSQAIAEQHYTGENQDRFCLWSRIPWPFEVILCVQCCWLLMSWDKKDFIKGKQESKVVAGLRWALQQRDDFGLFLRCAELLVLGWQWLCHSWDHGYCWALVTPGAVSGTWTLVLNLQPQTPTCNVAWSDLVHCPVLCPVWPEKGRGVPFSVRTLFVRTLQSRRAHWRWWISAIGSLWSPTLGEAWCIFWSVSITNSWVPENCYHLLQVHGGKFD